jgi:osmotically-inducible protein OsmY
MATSADSSAFHALFTHCHLGRHPALRCWGCAGGGSRPGFGCGAIAERRDATRTDAELQRAVLAELAWDPRVEETEVGVEVDQGVVTLTGTVSSYMKRLAAQEAAHRVAGVRDVANDIAVKLPGGTTQTDTEIAQAVRHALSMDVLVPHERITTTVSKGRVTLEGSVDLAYQRDDAAWLIGRLPGVRGVTNHLTIAGPVVAAGQLHESIEGALVRRAEREAGRITVDVRGDVATLTGAVRSWAEKRAVLGAARHTPGVRDVVDQLRIEFAV